MTKFDFRKKLLFILGCCIGTAVDIAILPVLLNLMNEWLAGLISYMVGVIIAFFWGRKALKVEDNPKRRLLSTVIIHIIGAGVQDVLLVLLLDVGLTWFIAKAVTIAENAILMYLLTLYVVFRPYKHEEWRAFEIWGFFKVDTDALFSNL